MDSTDPNHSISRNIPIPQWMKPRFQEGFDAEISTLSPPNQDDSFFYIPYSKLTKPVGSTGQPATGDFPRNTQSAIAGALDGEASTSKSLINKHTQPCLKFLGERKNLDMTDLTEFSKDDKKVSGPIKSFGTDDGFKSEAAQCGHSVVQVAQQMIADRFIGRPTKLSPQNGRGDSEMPHIKPRVRRGSKSLPASPLSTPDSTPQIQRKNRYFTGAFVEQPEESSKFAGGWLVASLLGVHRENLSGSQTELASDSNNNASLHKVQSSDTLGSKDSSSVILQSFDHTQSESGKAEDKQASPLHGSRSTASLVKMGNPGTEHLVKKARPKPSELREMNFWSPTSM